MIASVDGEPGGEIELRSIEQDGIKINTTWQRLLPDDEGYQAALDAKVALEAMPFQWFPVAQPPEEVSLGFAWAIQDYPQGTAVRVTDALDALVYEGTDATEAATFDEVGLYHLRVTPPPPHRGFRMRVICRA